MAFSLAGEQRELVRAIAEEVEKILGCGTVFLDEWYEAHLAGADADLKLQRIYGSGCDLAVYCISKEYDSKPWTKTEHAAIRARLTKSRASADEREQYSLLPIRVADGEVEGILFTHIVPDARIRSASESAELVVARLRLVLPDLKTAGDSVPARPEWPATPPPLSWPMADHRRARETFGQLLTASAPWRFLPLRGDSETGKSRITRQMLANVLMLNTIACGRFDFKGTTNMDREVRAFIQELGVSEPPPSSRVHERLDHILNSLRQRALPTLLIFDTYEMVGETQEWVEKQLLPSLIRSKWLRVVITGQKVPEPGGAIWAATASPVLRLERPQPPDWYEYGRMHRQDLTLAEVEMACRLAGYRCGLLDQLLGPAQ